MIAVLKPIAVRPIQRPAYTFAGTFDEWFSLNRAAIADYAYELAMASIDDDDYEPEGLVTFARCQYDIERSKRGLPLHVANPHDRCDVCGAENEHGEFFATHQNGRQIALCDACR